MYSSVSPGLGSPQAIIVSPSAMIGRIGQTPEELLADLGQRTGQRPMPHCSDEVHNHHHS